MPPTPNFFLEDGKLPLNADGSRYFKITLLNQVRMRYNESNPGTTVGGYAVPNTYDLGIRRFLTQLYGQLTARVFIYSQIGINNLAFNSDRKADGPSASAETATDGFPAARPQRPSRKCYPPRRHQPLPQRRRHPAALRREKGRQRQC